MRHAVLAAPKTIEWRDAPSPRLAAGEVLVDVRAALTCGTDLKTYRRGHPKLAFGPFGHEASGDIVAVGDGVTRFAAGDAVMWAPTAPCGSCVRCTNGTENLCLHLFDGIALGAYGKQIVLPPRVVATNVYRKPESLTYIEAAFLEPLAAVVHGWNVLLRADAASRTPRSVAIVGSGTIGMLHLLNAVRAGSSVTMISSTGPRAQLARDAGAVSVVDRHDASQLRSMTATFDAVIECAGTEAAWQQSIALARPAGRVLFFSGLSSGTQVALDAERIHYGELHCLGSFHFTPDDVHEAYELLVHRHLDVKPLITAVEPLDALAEVFARLDRREGYKYALVPGPGDARWI